MMVPGWFWFWVLLGCGASLAAPLAVRPLLRKIGAYDVPNARSSHTVTVVRGLGIGVWLAYAIVHAIYAGSLLVIAAPLPPVQSAIANLTPELQASGALFLLTSLAAVVGVLEDLRGLSVLQRSLAQLTIAALATWAALAVTGTLATLAWYLLLPLTIFGVLYISSFINVANFMDGLNGISALHGIVAGLSCAAVGWISAAEWLQFVGLLLAAVFLGFLPWNLAGRGFLGDVGSYFLGAAIVCTSFMMLVGGVPILAAIGPTVVYFGDVGWTLVQRYRRGAKLSEAHREHVYQRLQQAGLSHFAASGITTLCSAIAAGLGLMSMFFPGSVGFGVFLVLGLAVVAGYLALPRFVTQRRARHARVANSV